MTLNCHQLECFLRIGFNENDLKRDLAAERNPIFGRRTAGGHKLQALSDLGDG